MLVYLDSPAMVPSGSAIGRALQEELEADILMLVVDAPRHQDGLPKDFTIHDFGEVFSSARGPARIRRTATQFVHRVIAIALASPSLSWALQRLGLAPRGVGPEGRHASEPGVVLNPLGRLADREQHSTGSLNSPETPEKPPEGGRDVATESRHRSADVADEHVPVARRLLRRIRRAITGFHHHLTAPTRRFLLRFRIVREIRSLQSMRFYRRGMRRFLQKTKPEVIIVFEDNIETLTRILIAVGVEMGTPSAVVPYTIPNPLEPASSLVTSPDHISRPWAEKAISMFSRSRWVFEFEGKRLLRLPPARVLAMEMLGLSVPNPWILNSGSARAIALDSEMSRRAYLDLGFPKEQLEVVGEPVGAQLLEGLSHRSNLRRQIALENGFDAGDRPLLVCAFPPDQYRGTETRSFELPDFSALVEAWMEALLEVSRHANVLVRPHPRLNTHLLEAYETDQLKITWRPTAELVPAADLYVASISATIRWAIACGVPVINYDCYRYRYGDYKEAPGVLTLFSRDDFRAAALRFFCDATFANDLRKRQNAVRGDWGMIDALFPKRFGALVSRIIRQERGAP